jgi:hypothetical protein
MERGVEVAALTFRRWSEGCREPGRLRLRTGTRGGRQRERREEGHWRWPRSRSAASARLVTRQPGCSGWGLATARLLLLLQAVPSGGAATPPAGAAARM